MWELVQKVSKHGLLQHQGKKINRAACPPAEFNVEPCDKLIGAGVWRFASCSRWSVRTGHSGGVAWGVSGAAELAEPGPIRCRRAEQVPGKAKALTLNSSPSPSSVHPRPKSYQNHRSSTARASFQPRISDAQSKPIPSSYSPFDLSIYFLLLTTAKMPSDLW